ncbi:MAG: hypothetical protein HN368_08795 [Spirochaetales bacterium]|jgi:hypothetical protein|nr:hypothetical protein [Spirochaetales bacterium]
MHHKKPNWKDNWETTRAHYEAWWKREGPIITINYSSLLDKSRANTPKPPRPRGPREQHTDPEWFAANQRYTLSRMRFSADNLPIAHTDYGCVQLAACFGSEPRFSDDTVWYSECIDNPENWPALSLTKTEPWWHSYKEIMLKVHEVSKGDYLVGMPAFGSNLDVLAELRGTQNLLYDLIDRAGWVERKLEEINQAFFVAFDDYYEQIQLADGSSAYTYFSIWGPGKVSQVQCDFAAMISPEMFADFVVLPLQRQCAWLDRSLFHLDGPNCICHLEHLLAIPELDAIQWTPGAGQPSPGDSTWYGLYERILGAGKSVQILGTTIEEAKHILNTFGAKGVYLSVSVGSEAEDDDMVAFVDSMR